MVSNNPDDAKHFKPIPLTPEQEAWRKADLEQADLEEALEKAEKESK